ncbi:hypothetical protein CCACVL1_13038 [Corchorus capsularis]|uniref:DUF1771 domain-containing protein n=1 Tax=Corchorus capsularis TaxID=210143 RepID=A0A1R3ICL5_COCAP|nr:hypothetical protein CCACVL1_13038 [Corchorus capsularis]
MEGIVSAANPDEEALRQLLDVFGSQFSLEDIASAFYEAKGNVNVAGEILCSSNGGRALRADKIENKSVGARAISLESFSGGETASAVSSEWPACNPNNGASKLKKSSASMGSISGVIGNNYVKSHPSRKDTPETTKPVKIDSKELPVSLIWSEEGADSRTARNGTPHGDLEEFLFEMLGDGFQLDKSVIHEVLDCCGYDVKKSMDKLLDLSASTLEKSDDVIGIAARELTGTCADDQLLLFQDKQQCNEFAQSREATSLIRDPTRSPIKKQNKIALEKEVLEALFSVPERPEETPKRTRLVRVVRRSKAYGKLVAEPLKDADISLTSPIAELQKVSKDAFLCLAATSAEEPNDDNENSYDMLRQAVKEYWMTMKEYYKAAVEAFAEGDTARASKLMDLGHFFNDKAREADERSAKKIVEARDDEILCLDWRKFEPKEALNLLRVHLTSVSGIPSIKFLRIKVGTVEEDTKKGARKRLILQQLEKESIQWNEEENGSIISIRVDIINPKKLSFTKNKTEMSMRFS